MQYALVPGPPSAMTLSSARCRDNTRDFFEQCFPVLLKRLFGYDGSSWLSIRVGNLVIGCWVAFRCGPCLTKGWKGGYALIQACHHASPSCITRHKSNARTARSRT